MENKEIRKSKLVFDMRVCRKLLHAGMKCIDCKPLKTDKSKTVLVFEDTPEFQKAYEEISAEFKHKDDEKRLQEEPIIEMCD